MALPIKETPVISGQDADRFVRNMCLAESRPAPKADYDRAKKVYDAMVKKERELNFQS